MAKIKKIKLPNDSTEYEFEGSVTDISDTTSNIDSITTDYPDVSASDKASTLFGKIKKFLSDLKSKKQDNVTGAASTITSSNLTANRILQSDANGKVAESGYEFDINTNNTADTWLLVVKDGKIQHRLISSLADVSRAVKLKDYTDNNDTYLDYGSSAMADSNVTYVGAWDGYKLRAIKKEDMSVANAAWLRSYYPTRPTSANHLFGDGSLTHYKATSSMTTGKPANDGHIIHLAWDNKGGFDAQLAIFSTSNCFAQIRAQSNGTWGSWYYLIRGHAQANFSYAVTGIGKIADSNNFYATATSGNYYWSVAAWSDKRLKKNIKKQKYKHLF